MATSKKPTPQKAKPAARKPKPKPRVRRKPDPRRAPEHGWLIPSDNPNQSQPY